MKPLNAILALVGICLVSGLTGCATGPGFAQTKASLPALAPDQGRIYFYRTAVMGAVVQPSVKLNGERVGSAKAKGFFFVDRPPGNYQIETSTEVKRRLSLTLDQGQTHYVRLGVSMGLFMAHVKPELVEPGVGEKEISKCSYTGVP